MKKTLIKTNWLAFLDKYALFILSIFLLAFIPLYPKLPLFDLIEGYIVRVRLEDFLILFAVIVYFIQLLRKKITLETPLTKIIFAYVVVGFLSTLSGIFLTQTIPTTEVHLLKSFLHFARYIEYFSLFFLLAAAIQTKKQLHIALAVIVFTLLCVGLYGVGQKYFYWPVYSTMNREFSKGVTLYLTEFARVQSTFAGHYDMAAYLVIVLPIVLGIMLYVKNKAYKIILWIAYALGMLMMILSASRTSLAGLLIGLYGTIFLIALLKNTWGTRIWFFIKESILTGILFLVLFASFGSNMAERLLQSAESYPPVHMFITMIEDQKDMLIAQIEFNEALPEIKKPENGLSVAEAEVLVASDTRPTPIKPSDVKVDVPDLVRVATISAEGKETTIVVEVPRTYSENALRHGLSLAIRLDTLWPQALNGFYSNPALGSGYGTLTKSVVEEFTEADSTDNNFLRTLGETGALGFLTFYGTVAIAVYIAQKIIRDKSETDKLKKYFAVGYIGATIGLLLNATFIDVFAASKVAYTYWAITGMLIAYENIHTAPPVAKLARKKKKRKKKNQFSNI